VTYEVTDPTVDSQTIQLKDSGANVFFNISIPKFAAQSMRKAAEIGWKPVQYLNNVSAQVSTTMKPAGFENVQGVITAAWLKDPTDKQWDADAEMKMWREWMAKYNPSGNTQDVNYIYAFAVSFTMHETLKKCGNDLTRANLMKQAANHQKLRVPLLLPGITLSTSPTDFYPVQAVRLQRFKGETWELFGDILSAEST
jgi:branched-chain amino acid transport system substrate-binding protein